jgi:uncharacterized protein
LDLPGIEDIELPTDGDYKLLDDFLDSDKVSEDAMPLDMVDGFLTSLHCGPTTGLELEWLFVVFGTDEPEFDSDDEMVQVMGSLLLMFEETGLMLRGEECLHPILPWRKVDGVESADYKNWCIGFLEGMNFWHPCWQDYLDINLTAPLGTILIAGRQQVDDELGRVNKELDEVLKELPDMLPIITANIYDQLAPCRKKMVPGHVSQARKKKTGRNDPCPCGSGKKFKKCCAGLAIH